METIAIAVLTAMITSALMIWLFAPKPKKDDLSMFDAELTHSSSSGVIPVVRYGSTNPLECNECDFVAKSAKGLKTHHTRIHKV